MDNSPIILYRQKLKPYFQNKKASNKAEDRIETNLYQFLYLPISVNRSIVQDNRRLLHYFGREQIEIIHNFISVNEF